MDIKTLAHGYIAMVYSHNRRIGEDRNAKGPAMQLSARNQLKETVVDVVKGATTAHVRIDIGGAILTASITNEAVDALKLTTGQPAIAVIKASDVMVGVEG
jgi:molybdopterin-binding protein